MTTAARRAGAVAAVVLAATALVGAASAAPAAADTLTGTYYIDNGTGCSNANSGTSPSTAWCDFTNVNAATFGAGSHILLKRGDTWYQPMNIHGSGTSTSRNVIGAYGTGPKPIIRGHDQASDRTILMRDNPNYWTVEGLELSHAADGIRASYTMPSEGGLIFRDLYIHDIDYYVQNTVQQGDYLIYWSTSITVDGSGFTPTASAPAASNILIDDVRTENTTAPSILTPGCGDPVCAHGGFTNVTIRNSTFLNGNGGMSLQGVANATVESNVISGMGEDAKSSGQTALFLWQDDHVAVTNNIVESTADTGSPDETGIDLEGYNDDIQIRGNLFRNHPGAGIEILDLAGRAGDYNTNVLIAQNEFYKNELDPTNGMHGVIWIDNSPGAPTSGAIRDNVDYEPTSSTFLGGAALGSTWTVSDNLAGTETGLDVSSWNFGSMNPTGNWHDQVYDGSRWKDISNWDGAGAWTSGDAAIQRFNLSPGSAGQAWVSRMWQAPTTGVVDLRSAVQRLDTGGDGVGVLIAKNNTVIWPASGGYVTIGPSDTSIVEAMVSGLSVAAGDRLRFEVYRLPSSDRTSDTVSWTPVVSYQP